MLSLKQLFLAFWQGGFENVHVLEKESEREREIERDREIAQDCPEEV